MGTGALALIGVLASVAFGAVGFMLRRLINAADAAQTIRHQVLVEAVAQLRADMAGMARRYDTAFTALNDTIHAGFEQATKDRGVLGERVARLEGPVSRVV